MPLELICFLLFGVAAFLGGLCLSLRSENKRLKELAGVERSEKIDWANKALMRVGQSPLAKERKDKLDTEPKHQVKIVTRADLEARRAETQPTNQVNPKFHRVGTVIEKAAEIINATK